MKTTQPYPLIRLALVSILLTAGARAEYVADADPATSGNQPGSIYVPVSLGGNTISEGWEKLTSTMYPGNGSFPGLGAWSGPLVSQVGDDAGANGLVKVSNGVGGGPYPGSQSIYFGGTGLLQNTYGGTLAVEASGDGLLDDVQTVVFQIDIGEAWTHDFYDDLEPVLVCTTTSGVYEIDASHASLYGAFYNGQVYMNFEYEDLYINSWAFQFDLSQVAGTVTGIEVEFHGVQHAQVHGLGLQQSDQDEDYSVLPESIN